MISTLKDHDIEVREVAVILNRSKDVSAIAKEIGVPIRTVLDVAVFDGKPTVY